jgi:hypothetical protein
MAKQLDPRMIGSNGPIRTDSVISNTLTALSGDIYDFNSVNIVTTDLIANNITNNSNLITTNLSSNNITVSSLNIINNTTSNFLIQLEVVSPDITFSDSDKSKIFHINTTINPLVTAIFPGDLSDGFNVSLINTGIGAINLSAGLPFNAISQFNTVQHTGVLIYKYNNQFYGIGVFE